MQYFSDEHIKRLIAIVNEVSDGYQTCDFDLQSTGRQAKQLLAEMVHYHKNNAKDDICYECGLDLRNPIHTRGWEWTS